MKKIKKNDIINYKENKKGIKEMTVKDLIEELQKLEHQDRTIGYITLGYGDELSKESARVYTEDAGFTNFWDVGTVKLANGEYVYTL